MRTTAVVLNFNNHRATLACVDSLAGQRELDAVIVVDNGSVELDRQALVAGVERRPQATLVCIERNLGFGGGMNAGMAAALDGGADCLFLLNNDTLVGSDAVHHLRTALMADTHTGIAAPLITTKNGVIWAAGGTVSTATLKPIHLLAGTSASAVVPPREISFAPGAALLVSARALRACGGFAESFFLYCEDLEFSIRIRESGFGIRFVPQATVWHAVQGGDPARTARSMYYRGRNSLWLGRQRLSPGVVPLYTALVFTRLLRAALRRGKADPIALARLLGQLLRGMVAGAGPMPDAAPRRFPE